MPQIVYGTLLRQAQVYPLETCNLAFTFVDTHSHEYWLHSVCFSLLRSGYFEDAFTLLFAHPEPTQTEQTFVHQWLRLLLENRLGRAQSAAHDLLQLTANLSAFNAQLCLLDALSIQPLGLIDNPHLYLQRLAASYLRSENVGAFLHCMQIWHYVALTHGLHQLAQGLLQIALWFADRQVYPFFYARFQLGQAYHARRDMHYASARHFAQEAKEIGSRFKHPSLVELATLETAYIFQEQGQYQRATQQIERLSKKKAYLAAPIALSQATTNFHSFDVETSISQYEEAHLAAQQMGNWVRAAIAQLNLGVALQHKGKISSATTVFSRVEQQAQDLASYEVLVSAFSQIGLLLASLGFSDRAQSYFATCLDMLETLGISNRGLPAHQAILSLTNSISKLDQYAELLKRLFDFGNGPLLAASIADCAEYLAQSNYRDCAEALYRIAIDLYQYLEQPAKQGNCKVKLARLLVASSRMTEARLLLAEGWSYTPRWLTSTVCAELAVAEGRTERAKRAYSRAFAAIRKLRLETQEPLGSAQLALQHHALYVDALQISDDPIYVLNIVELHEGNDQITQQGLSRLRSNLDKQHPGGWTVLRYYWYEDQLGLVSITPEACTLHRRLLSMADTPALHLISAAPISYRQVAYDTSTPQSQYIRAQILKKLIQQDQLHRLCPKHHIRIVPAGVLRQIGFAALLNDDKPLVHSAQLSIGRSAISRHQSKSQFNQRLFLGQSRFTSEKQPALPYVEQEAKLMRQYGFDVHLNEANGLVSHDVLEQVDLLHISTHATFDELTGRLSGFMLGAQTISLDTIASWQLRFGLVVLSVCHSGIDRWMYGGEVSGLAHAFLDAGARQVIASQWQAADVQTAQLMRLFYEVLDETNVVAAALAHAQRQLDKQKVAPFYWANFTLFD